MLTTKKPQVLLMWAQAILEDDLDSDVDTYLSWMCVRHNRLIAKVTEAIELDGSLLTDVDKLKAWYQANK
jgi:hypothetical protein